jgi:hypothetical protein
MNLATVKNALVQKYGDFQRLWFIYQFLDSQLFWKRYPDGDEYISTVEGM